MSAMRVHRPRQPNGLVVVTDWTSKTDRQLDEAEGGVHVLDTWRFGKEVLGAAYRDATRVALFQYGDTPSTKAAAATRDEWRMFLEVERPAVVALLPTPDASSGEKMALKGTQCWEALHAPDGLDEMRGTFWRHGASYIVPLFSIQKRSKELQRWAMARWLSWAHKAARGGLEPIVCPRKETRVTDGMLDLLFSLRGRPLAVDLEFVPTSGVITAIGLANHQVGAVSVPWDTFTPRRGTEPEPGIKSYGQLGWAIERAVADLLAAPTRKVAHNFVADIPRLEGRGMAVGGELHDTFAAHAIAFPELRHGLQHACASLFPCAPWKSSWKPQGLKGITREDSEFWTCEPLGLRDYNCDDAFFTEVLANFVLPCVGVRP